MKDKDKTKEQLINELEQMHQRVVEFEGSATTGKRKKEDEKYMSDLAFLSMTAIGLLELSPEEDIYEFIGRQLRELVGNSIIIVNSFEGATDSVCARAVLGVGKKMGSVVRILGKHPVGMSLPIDDEARLGLGSRKLVKVPGGLYEFSFRRIPRTICRAIEKLLDLGDIYAMGFVWKGELFGNANILTLKGTELKDQGLIETFVKQASVALQRHQMEKALQKAYDTLEIRVEERTRQLTKINEQLRGEITERKQVEKQVRESERRFKDITENASEWVWETDVNGKYIYASPVCEKILGYKPEELFAKHFYDLFLPEEREQLKKAAFETFVKKQSFREFINPNVHKNGEIVWLSTSGVPILDERGNLLGYRGADIDITERRRAEETLRESEEKLRTIIENTRDVIFQLSPLGVIQYVSPQVKDLYGYEPEDLIGKHLKKTTPLGELPRALEVIKTVLSGKVINNFEINQVDANGKIIPVEINATPVRKGGKIIAAQGVMRDITERKRMEKELRELYEVEKSQREELEEEVKARGLLINALAHELRTPLTPILASAGILKENLSSSPETDEFKLASNILMGTELLTSRLEEFLIFAKFTSGAFSLKTQLIDTREFIKGVALQLMSAGDEGEQRFILELPQNLPKIEADPSYLQQVVTILLSNATKFSSKEENVTLRAKTESGELVVEVEAKGVGMSAKEQHRILRPYHRTEQDRQRFPGLGLGIAVSKRIIEAHGGKMWLSSKLGKGTTFSFSLPLRSEERKPRH
ncbi:MAG: PAS domain S-box protein [Desulfobacteraceae bacterium]|nr:PAS domain S-box protein [Desulfobacteraceae bacterium]